MKMVMMIIMTRTVVVDMIIMEITISSRNCRSTSGSGGGGSCDTNGSSIKRSNISPSSSKYSILVIQSCPSHHPITSFSLS